MTCGIYAIKHINSGRIYIGSAVNIRKRWHVHRHHLKRGTHHSSKLQRAWSKHGESAFEFFIIGTCEEDELLSSEQFFLDETSSAKNGFNCNPNAESWLGRKHSQETRAKIAAIKLGIPVGIGHVVSSETRAKIAASHKGKVVSEKARENLRLARIGKTPALGMRHSEESRSKMARSQSARWRDMSELKKRQLLTNLVHTKGVPRSAEVRAKVSTGLKAYFSSKRVSTQ